MNERFRFRRRRRIRHRRLRRGDCRSACRRARPWRCAARWAPARRGWCRPSPRRSASSAATSSVPTFVLVQEHHGRRDIYHIDAYRLRDEDEFLALGPEEFFESDALVFVEWADRVESCLPRQSRRDSHRSDRPAVAAIHGRADRRTVRRGSRATRERLCPTKVRRAIWRRLSALTGLGVKNRPVWSNGSGNASRDAHGATAAGVLLFFRETAFGTGEYKASAHVTW